MQTDPLELESLEPGTTMTTNMASILPPASSSVPEPENSQRNKASSKSTKSTEQTLMDGPIAAAAVEADTGDKDKNYVPGKIRNA